MIKGITGGQFIQIQGGQPSATYINNYGSNSMLVGQIRYNTQNQNMEVYDGNNWQVLGTSYATIDLNYDAQQLLEWARKERDKQMQREARVKNNPALQKAWEAIQRAEANFDILEKFVEHDHASPGLQTV